MKTSHKKVRIKKGRLVLLVGLIALTVYAGYMSKESYPAEPTSAWYMLFLVSIIGILSYAYKYVGSKPQTVRRRGRD